MKNSLKAYVDGLFSNTPPSPALEELHDEILSNLSERYDDCINAGMSPQRAYTAVIGTMGDVSGLIAQVSGSGVHEVGLFEKASPKARLMSKYAYVFKESNIKAIKGAAIAVMWLAIVFLFFAIGQNGAWDTSWLIFIIGAALTVGINMISGVIKHSKSDDTQSRIKVLNIIHGNVSAIMWLAVTFLFFVIGFGSYSWDSCWLIFLVGAAAQIILSTVFKVLKSRFKD